MTSKAGTRRHLRLRPAVWTRDAGICWRCKEPCDERSWHVDHLIMRFMTENDYWKLDGYETFDELMMHTLRGHWWGIDSIDNLAVSHPQCNTSRPIARYRFDGQNEAADDWAAATVKLIENQGRRLWKEGFDFKTETYRLDPPTWATQYPGKQTAAA